jgi:hypothetical protein
MSIADQLKQTAIEVLNRITERKARIRTEYEQIEAARLQKKAELDAQINAESDARQRLLDFQPSREGQFMCPRCWTASGKYNALTPIPSGTSQDLFRCHFCNLELSI